MKLLESKRGLKLPQIYFITDKEKIKDIPIGVPFIFGDAGNEENLVRILEYEVLYQQAIKSGYPFNFKKILLDCGFLDIEDFWYADSIYMELTTEGLINIDDDGVESCKTLHDLRDSKNGFKDYIRDSAVYVDIAKLKELNVFPVWLDKIEDAVYQNIHNFAVHNPNMYNKKLEGMYGGIEFASPSRNLIIIDISGSIPRGVSSTCLSLAKNLSETFYADLMITGSKTTIYQYENLHELNINTIYQENGMNNDQYWFKKLLTSEERHYKTAIVFGDNDSPGEVWGISPEGVYDTRISDKDGQKICKWKVDKLISFHTKGTEHIAAYGRWFTPEETERIEDWVKYLNK